jgi:branched-chain amino acid aminotransferase
MNLVYLNGNFVPEDQAVVSVFDHGFLYGDGAFEGIRAYDGKIFKLDEHVERLFDSAKALMLDIRMSKEEMKNAIIETVKRNGLKDAYIRPVVSRGRGAMGINPKNCNDEPTVVVIASKIKALPEDVYKVGVKAIVASTRRSMAQMLNPRLKSLNYLVNLFAKLEANNAGADEAVMLNTNGYVTEGSVDNIFIVKDYTVYTPPVYAGVLKGITRDTIIMIAEDIGLKVKEELFTPFEIYTADECFMTGTAVELAPIVSLDGRIVGDGKPGPITARLSSELKELVKKEGTPIY